MMKKLTALVISLVYGFYFAGCGIQESEVSDVYVESDNDVVVTVSTVETSFAAANVATAAALTKISEPAIPTGIYEATTTLMKTAETAKRASIKKRVTLPVRNIQQIPELPMGCEAVSASIALQYNGFLVDKFTLLKYQPMMEEPDKDGNWGNPWEVFVGNPATYKYGCYSPVIKRAIEDYWKDTKVEGFKVVDLGGSKLTDLYSEIDEGNPVIIWVSTFMKGIETDKVSWTLKEDGSVFHWTLHEHCVVLIGYDTGKDKAIISDPYDPKGTVEYDRKLVEKSYNQMFKQALVIHKTGK
jgi:Uncharacterized protein conserved in bacteria